MTSETPDWLAQRGGRIEPGTQADTWIVIISGRPLYRLEVRPALGQYDYWLTQTVNGRTTAGDKRFSTREDAVRAGLQALRENLGW
jgi:hypothetical protein